MPASNPSRVVGLIVPNIKNAFFAELAVGVEREFDRLGRLVLLTNTSEDHEKQDRTIATLLEHRVEGILFCPAIGSRPESLRPIMETGVPFMFVTRYIPDVEADFVGPDNFEGARLATSHLLKLGHKRVAFVGGFPASSPWTDRSEGFKAAYRESGQEFEPSLLLPTEISVEGGFRAAMDLVGMHVRPSAALCYNDMIALGFIRGLEKQGIIAGWDFSIIGFDDIQQAASWRPSLSTLNTQPEKIGGEAARALIGRMAGAAGPPRRVLLLPELVLRESSNSLPNVH